MDLLHPEPKTFGKRPELVNLTGTNGNIRFASLADVLRYSKTKELRPELELMNCYQGFKKPGRLKAGLRLTNVIQANSQNLDFGVVLREGNDWVLFYDRKVPYGIINHGSQDKPLIEYLEEPLFREEEVEREVDYIRIKEASRIPLNEPISVTLTSLIEKIQSGRYGFKSILVGIQCVPLDNESDSNIYLGITFKDENKNQAILLNEIGEWNLYRIE